MCEGGGHRVVGMGRSLTRRGVWRVSVFSGLSWSLLVSSVYGVFGGVVGVVVCSSVVLRVCGVCVLACVLVLPGCCSWRFWCAARCVRVPKSKRAASVAVAVPPPYASCLHEACSHRCTIPTARAALFCKLSPVIWVEAIGTHCPWGALFSERVAAGVVVLSWSCASCVYDAAVKGMSKTSWLELRGWL